MTVGNLGDVSDLPDHGYGPLGQAAHGLLAADAPTDQPVIGMVYNTLADAPGPPRCSEFDLISELWQAAGEDVHRYLILLARGIRFAPPPDPRELDGRTKEQSVPTRLDGLALVCQSAALRPATSGAGKALAANLAEGYYRRGDVASSPAAERGLMAIGVDRDGHTLLFSARGGRVGPAVDGPPERQRIEGPLVEELTELLAAFWSMMERADQLVEDDE